MILKDLQEKYSVLKNNGEYQIYDKTIGSGKYLNIRYLCNLEKVGSDKYKIVPSKHFDGVCSMNTFLPTKDIEILSSCILEYTNSLRFHSDCYCPSYRDNVFFTYAISEYLKNIGFENGKSTHENSYILKNKDIYSKIENVELGFRGLDMLDDNENSNVNIVIYTSYINYGYVSLETEKDINKIIDSINSLLLPLFLTNSIKYFKLSESLDSTFGDFNNIKKVEVKNFKAYSIDYKQQLKENLIELLNKLN